MAERIKGLQIDLSLNDMDVSKKLASVKREFRALNTSMKVSNNNFKYGDKSAASYKKIV
jgi:phage-related minor tail protein